MPNNFASIESRFPTFTGKESPQQQVKLLTDYIYQLTEQLRYQLNNLDGSNWNMTELGKSIIKVLEAEGILAQWITAGVIKSKDGTSVVIDLDEGNVDLTGSLVTKLGQWNGVEQKSSITPQQIMVETTEGDRYVMLTASQLYAWMKDVGEANLSVVPVYSDGEDGMERTFYTVLTLRNMVDGVDNWLTLSARPDRVVVHGLTAPVEASDAANKEYVDKIEQNAFSYAEVKAGDALFLAKKYANERIVHNYLDNSDFRNPVNQRGKSSYDSTGYTIDRWYGTCYGSAGEYTLSVENGYIRVVPNVDYARIYQKLENYAQLAGKKCTLAVNIDGTVYTTVLTMGADAGGEQLAANVKAYSTSSLHVIIDCYAAKNLYWAALYEGEYTAETVPPYLPKGYAHELAECRRYYQELDYNAMGNGYSVGTGSMAILAHHTDVYFRVTPTLVSNGATIYARVNGTDYSTSVSEISMKKYGNAPTVEIILYNSNIPEKHAASFYADKPVALSADL